MNQQLDTAAFTSARDARRALVTLARSDFDLFVELIGRDEITGDPLTQAWFHRAWTGLRRAHDRLVILSFPEAGKTQQIAALVLWHLGRNPRLRLVVISRTQGQAIDVVGLVRAKIEAPGILHEIFPDLRPSSASGARWTQTQLDVERPAGIKEPSVQAFGLSAGAITGKRVDGFILDDILDVRTTRTRAARLATSKQFWGEIYNRKSAKAWFVVIGNPWHPEDWYCELERRGWATFRFPVVVDQQLKRIWGAACPPIGTPTWPERWTIEQVQRLEIEMPPKEFRRAYLAQVDADAGSPFKSHDMDAALERGRAIGQHENVDSLELAWNLLRLSKIESSASERERLLAAAVADQLGGTRTSDRPALDAVKRWTTLATTVAERLAELGDEWEELVLITGCDPSTGNAKDPTALVTTAWSRKTHERLIVDVDYGWWELPEIMERTIDAWERWDSVVVVETVGVQRWGEQTLKALRPEMVVERLSTTGERKASMTSGLPAFAHRFSRGIVWIANNGVLTGAQQQLIRGATSFDPESHPDDVLMAAWFCDHWIYHRGERRGSSVSVKTFG